MSKKEKAEKAEKAGRSRTKKVILTILFILLGLLAATVCTAGVFAYRTLGSIHFDRADDSGFVSYSDIEPEDEVSVSDAVVLTEEESAELYNDMHELLTDDNDLIYQENVTNILLIGTDNRRSSGSARADAIILLSVNRDTKQLVMTSIMRDTAVIIGSRKSADKLTHAYSYGGADLLIRTIQANLGIRVDRYLAIDFYSFIDVVDRIGGIEMDVSESERKVMNRYVREINRYLELDPEDGYLTESGECILLTGKQTLGYVRNRYSNKAADFGRTQRQRDVLTKIIKKAENLSFFELCGLLDEFAPNLTTDYSRLELVSEAMNVMEYREYEIVQSRVPFDDTWYYGHVGSVGLVCYDFGKNRDLMLEVIYGEDALRRFEETR